MKYSDEQHHELNTRLKDFNTRRMHVFVSRTGVVGLDGDYTTDELKTLLKTINKFDKEINT
tara:strand:- start:1091 stop:1273 length:183 start_codon:yes stop_codon:yes gene_type:complete